MEGIHLGSGDRYITKRSPEYVEAVEVAYRYFHRLGYKVWHGHAFLRKDNRVAAIANIYCKNEKNDTDLALVITFPHKKQRSTERVLEKIETLSEFSDSVGVILCNVLGTGTFPYVSQRIWETMSLARVFSCNVAEKKIREILRS